MSRISLYPADSGGGFQEGAPATAGVVPSYVGYDVAGSSEEGLAINKVVHKKIVLPNNTVVLGISAYVRSDSNNHVDSIGVAVLEDNAGNPGTITAYCMAPPTSFLPETSPGNTNWRWLHMPIGAYLPAGIYHISLISTTTYLHIAYDVGGSDLTSAQTGPWFADGGYVTLVDSTYNYSIRASILS